MRSASCRENAGCPDCETSSSRDERTTGKAVSDRPPCETKYLWPIRSGKRTSNSLAETDERSLREAGCAHQRSDPATAASWLAVGCPSTVAPAPNRRSTGSNCPVADTSLLPDPSAAPAIPSRSCKFESKRETTFQCAHSSIRKSGDPNTDTRTNICAGVAPSPTSWSPDCDKCR